MAISSFSGLASGMDTAALVKALVTAERQPITRMERQKADLGSISTKFSNFKDLLTKLKDAVTGLKGRSDLLASTARSSDEKAIAVSASGGATIGSFDLTVTTLASAQRNQSEAFESKTEAAGFANGALTIQVGTGEAVSITVTESTSLNSLAQEINRKNAGVSAAVIFTNGEYRLQVSGNSTGEENAVTFGGSAADELALAAYQVRDAKNAEFTLDGLEMTSATNVITDAVPGLSFTLKGETTGVTLDVSRDNAAIKTKLQGFVDAYNAIATKINGEFAYTGAAKTSGTLSGDSGLRSVQSRLRAMVGTQLELEGSALTGLFSIGIRTQQDGTLKIDSTAMDDALAKNPEDVAQLLTNEAGSTESLFAQFESTLKDMVSGDGSVVSQRISNIAGRVRRLDDQMARMEVQIDSYEAKLKMQFTLMETSLSKLQNQGNQLNSMLASL